MPEEKRDLKREQEDRRRSAEYLLSLFEKYGAEIRAEKAASEDRE